MESRRDAAATAAAAAAALELASTVSHVADSRNVASNEGLMACLTS